MVRLVSILVMAVALGHVAACNPRYCAGNPDDDCRKSWDAGPTVCKGNSDCTAPMAVCDLDMSMTCVQCTPSQAGACVGVTPACVSNQCQKCTAHAQCSSSNVCLPEGTCADALQVAYVAAGGSGTTCTKASPCATLDDGVKAGKPIVKMATGVVADTKTTTIDGKAIVILADPGAKLDRSGDGVILEVRSNGADVKIYDLEITGGTGTASDAAVSIPNGGSPKLTLTRVTIRGNQGIGISAATGTLTVAQSTIINNQGGGISVTGATSVFDISSSFIVYNGRALGQPSDVGGAALTSNTGASRFEWNTVAFNESNGLTFRGGVSCNGPMATAAGNLIYHNAEPDGTGGTKTDATTQKNAAGCQFGSTLAVAVDATSLGFKSPLIMPFDFHLTAATPSTIVNAGGVCSGVDFDGDTRPIGAACDLGADEYKP